MVCFNRHIYENAWKIEEWRFFLDDLSDPSETARNRMARIEPGAQRRPLHPRTSRFFESRGAIVDGKRLVWGLDELHYRVLLDLGRLETAAMRKAPALMSSPS